MSDSTPARNGLRADRGSHYGLYDILYVRNVLGSLGGGVVTKYNLKTYPGLYIWRLKTDRENEHDAD